MKERIVLWFIVRKLQKSKNELFDKFKEDRKKVAPENIAELEAAFLNERHLIEDEIFEQNTRYLLNKGN
jgi:hypothetical protein